MKSCPFCGSDKIEIIDISCQPYAEEHKYWAQCQCSASGPVRDIHDDAVSAWDRRDDDAVVSWIDEHFTTGKA